LGRRKRASSNRDSLEYWDLEETTLGIFLPLACHYPKYVLDVIWNKI
jgi:hypothetical protein